MSFFGSLFGWEKSMGALNAVLASHLLDKCDTDTRKLIAAEVYNIITSIRRGQPLDAVLMGLSGSSRIVQMNFVALACDNLGISPPVRNNVWTRIQNPYQLDDGQISSAHIFSAVDVIAKQDVVRIFWPGNHVKIDFLLMHREGICVPGQFQVRSAIAQTEASPRSIPSVSQTTDINPQQDAKANARDFFTNFPELFVCCVSKHYSLTEKQIVKHEKLLNWHLLSGNERLEWTDDLIDLFLHKWDWCHLSQLKKIQWDSTRIDKYLDRFDFEAVSESTEFGWSELLIDRYADSWNWSDLCGNESIPWTVALVEKYSRKITTESGGLAQFQMNPKVYKSDALLEAVVKLDGDWAWVSRHVPWNAERIEKYRDNIWWPAFCGNKNVVWTEDLVRKLGDKADWFQLGANPALPWSTEFFERYKGNWVWGSNEQGDGLSSNPSLPWSYVSAQQTHIELMPVVSQDRVHANHRGHYAQRFRDFQIFSPTHPPDLRA